MSNYWTLPSNYWTLLSSKHLHIFINNRRLRVWHTICIVNKKHQLSTANIMKISSDIKSFFKFLTKNKLYTLIEIFGLSVSLMFVILIAVYTQQEMSTDHFQKKGDRIYALGNEIGLGAAYGIGEKLMERYPEIEKVISISSNMAWGGGEYLTVSHNDKNVNAKVYYTYEDFFDLFSFDLIKGNKMQILSNPHSAVISESFAHALFGDQDPIGQTIQLTETISVSVSGVMKDISNSILPYCDILTRMERLTEMYPEMRKDNYNNAFNSMVFLLAKPGADLPSKAGEILLYLKEFYPVFENGMAKKVVFMPMRKAYFSNTAEYSWLVRGDWKFVMILFSVGILILIFAITNYINLTIAQTGSRAKEIAMRSLLGATRKELFSRLIAESTLVCFLSFIIGLIFAAFFLPYVNDLLQTQISLSQTFTGLNVLLAILFILLLGTLSGLLPALHIIRTKSIDVVKGNFRLRTKMTFSKFFIIFQHAITIGMIVASLVMILQINHLIKAPLGYRTHNIMNIHVLEIKNRSLLETLASELKQLSSVSRVGLAQSTPFSAGTNYTMQIEGRTISFQGFEFDTTAFNILGLQILSDNQLATSGGCYLNQRAFQMMNISKDTRSFPFFGNPRAISGMIKDFQLSNITHEQSPVIVQIQKSENVRLEDILIEIQGDPFKAYKEIKNVYERLIPSEFPGKFVDQQIEESFASQRRISKIILVFSFIAIVISLLGLLAMSTYFIQQRKREIAIRKVFGSDNLQILGKLIKTFLLYVGIAFVIATPVTWYIMSHWLAHYAYRITLSPLIFITGGLFCLLASLGTIFWQSYKAANQNPVDNVKAE